MGKRNWFKKNQSDQIEQGKQENSIYKFLDREGFYIILFVCVCIVATTAVWVAKTNIDRLALDEPMEPLKLEEKEMVSIPSDMEEVQKNPTIVVEEITDDEGEESTPTISIPVENPEEDDQDQEVIESKPEIKKSNPKITASPAPIQKEEAVRMTTPVAGKIGMKYAVDTLTYSKTLEQYTTHHGIDIIAPEHTPVMAALRGEVIEVTKDGKLGLIITLAHGEDLMTRYANLSTDAMVKEGDFVEQGQIISGIGKNALFEISEEPHLHFEVLIDGQWVDPNKYLVKK